MLKIKKAELWTPPLDELAIALRTGLENHYETAAVAVVDCPDLRDIGCAGAGLCGSTRLVELGGEPYAHNPAHRDTVFDMAEIAAACQLPEAFVLGAGIAAREVLRGHCGELIPCATINGLNRSRAARVDERKNCVVENYDSTRHGGLANLFLCDGRPGPVLKIEVGRRTGTEGSFPRAIRNSLLDHCDVGGDRQIGLGGVFRVLGGRIRSHVMPDYECIEPGYYDIEQERVVRDFLQFYDHMGPDLLCFTVLWTGDPTGSALHLRDSGEHTHFFSTADKPEAGHYHYDTTPADVRYLGYFSPGESLYRVNDIYEEIEAGSAVAL